MSQVLLSRSANEAGLCGELSRGLLISEPVAFLAKYKDVRNSPTAACDKDTYPSPSTSRVHMTTSGSEHKTLLFCRSPGKSPKSCGRPTDRVAVMVKLEDQEGFDLRKTPVKRRRPDETQIYACPGAPRQFKRRLLSSKTRTKA
eukprot:scaffold185279_cov46-Prasinocladus_malaysianus.AAC.1